MRCLWLLSPLIACWCCVGMLWWPVPWTTVAFPDSRAGPGLGQEICSNCRKSCFYSVEIVDSRNLLSAQHHGLHWEWWMLSMAQDWPSLWNSLMALAFVLPYEMMHLSFLLGSKILSVFIKMKCIGSSGRECLLSQWIRLIALYAAEVFSMLVVLVILAGSPDSKALWLHFAL